MNRQQINGFRQMLAQLEALHQEMTSLSKKGPDKPLGSFKIKIVNNILSSTKNFLGDSAPQLDFDAFDADDLPTVSDVSFVAAQYLECSEKLRCENIFRMHNGAWYWTIDGVNSDIATKPPKGGR